MSARQRSSPATQAIDQLSAEYIQSEDISLKKRKRIIQKINDFHIKHERELIAEFEEDLDREADEIDRLEQLVKKLRDREQSIRDQQDERIKDVLATELGKLTQRYNNELEDLQSKHDQKTHDNEQNYQLQVNQANTLIQGYEDEVNALKKRYDEEFTKHSEKHQSQAKIIAEQKRKIENQIADLKLRKEDLTRCRKDRDFHMKRADDQQQEQEVQIGTLQRDKETAIKIAQQKHDDILLQRDATHQLAVDSLNTQIVQLGIQISDHKSTNETMKKQHDFQLKTAFEERDRYHEAKIQELEQEHERDTRGLIEKHGTQFQNYRDQCDSIISNLNAELSQSDWLAKQVKLEHKKELNALSDALEAKLHTQETEYEGRIASLLNERANDAKVAKKQQSDLERACNQQISDLTQRHKQQLDKLARERENDAKVAKELLSERERVLNEQINKMNEQRAREAKIADEQRSELERSYNERIKTLVYQHEEGNALMKASFATEKKAMQDEFTAKSAGMKQHLSKLSASLMTRDDDVHKAKNFSFNIKPLEDPTLKAMFSDLAKLVDDVGRFEWKSDQHLWSNDVLQRLSRVQNLTIGVVKRYIIQDCIWILLYRYIFCSPFRIFGAEGSSFDRQWAKNGGIEIDQKTGSGSQDALFTWPEPTFETERWRYVNITECRAALRQKLSGHDPRAAIKKGFKDQSESLRTETESCLSELVGLNSTDRDKLDELRMLAIKLWLEFSMQRCRLRIMMHGTRLNSIKDKASQAGESSIELIVCPSLGRHGNADGFELTEYSTLKGCNGSLVKLP